VDLTLPSTIVSCELTKSGMIMFEKNNNTMLDDKGRENYFKLFAKEFVDLEKQKLSIKDKLQSNFIDLLKNSIKVIVPYEEDNKNSEFCVLTVIKNLFDDIEKTTIVDYFDKSIITAKEKNDFCKVLYKERYETIIKSIDIVTKNIQLLSGGKTENIGVETSLSKETLAALTTEASVPI
jgi:hypothetical protein